MVCKTVLMQSSQLKITNDQNTSCSKPDLRTLIKFYSKQYKMLSYRRETALQGALQLCQK